MKSRVLVLALFLFVLVLAACSTATPTPAVKARVLKLSLAVGDTSTWYKGATRFADLVKQRTNGRLAISVFPNASLASGDQNKELEMLQSGGIDFSFNSTSQYANLDPRFSATMLPWLFTGNADVDKMLSGPQGQELLKAAEGKNVVGLAWAENGFRQLTNSKRDIKTPDDLKGLKIRIPSTKMFESSLMALGAKPVKMNIGEAFAAMRDGEVDGQENPLDNVISNKFYDVQKYVTIWNYSYSALVLGANKTMWDSLDAETQKIVRKAAEEAAAYQVQETRKLAESQLQLLKDKGMSVTTLSPDQIQEFRNLVASVYTDAEPTIGKDFLDKFRAANQ